MEAAYPPPDPEQQGEGGYDPASYALVTADPPAQDEYYADPGAMESAATEQQYEASSEYQQAASVYGEGEYAAQEGDPYNAEEAGIAQSQQQLEEEAAYGAYEAQVDDGTGAGFGEMQSGAQAGEEAGGYRRLKGGLTIATAAGGASKVNVAPPEALSPTTYDYNKDMWGDMWSYEAQAPSTEVRLRPSRRRVAGLAGHGLVSNGCSCGS